MLKLDLTRQHPILMLDVLNMEKLMDNIDLMDVHNTTDLVFKSAHKYLEELNDGEKTTIGDLADKVSVDTNLPYSNVLNLVSMYVHQYKGVSVERGRNGGVFKGGKPKKIGDVRPRCETCNQTIKEKKPSSANVIVADDVSSKLDE